MLTLTKLFCPNCNHHLSRHGSFRRKSDAHIIQRYYCKKCNHSHSSATKNPCYRQNKRHLNLQVQRLLCSGVSQRRIALILRVSRRTVYRKFQFLAAQAVLKNSVFLDKFKSQKIKEIFLDEMEDRIHTKCKPVAIALIVTKERKILLHKTSRIRPKNSELNQFSHKKYPYWIDNSRKGFNELIQKAAPILDKKVIIKSDEKNLYSQVIKKILPESEHQRFKSRKAVVAGQKELKQGGRDPLFPLNHTCAMFRANINRLIRRTWCTSKKIEALSQHIEIYTHFHNTVLTS